MKLDKFFALFFRFFLFFIVGCKEESIIGMSYSCYESEDEDFDCFLLLTFNQNGTYTASNDIVSSGKFEFDKQNNKIDLYDEDELSMVGHLSADGKILTLNRIDDEDDKIVLNQEIIEKEVVGHSFLVNSHGLISRIIFHENFTYDSYAGKSSDAELQQMPSSRYTFDRKHRKILLFDKDNSPLFWGEFSADWKTLNVYETDYSDFKNAAFIREDSGKNGKGTTYISSDDNKLTKKSIEVCGLTFDSTPADLILLYPDAGVLPLSDYGGKKYMVQDVDGFDGIEFAFFNDVLLWIEKYKSKGDDTGSIVQKEVRNLTEKYGKPELEEISYYSIYEDANKNEREYRWWESNEISINIKYSWYSGTSYGGKWSEECSIEYRGIGEIYTENSKTAWH